VQAWHGKYAVGEWFSSEGGRTWYAYRHMQNVLENVDHDVNFAKKFFSTKNTYIELKQEGWIGITKIATREFSNDQDLIDYIKDRMNGSAEALALPAQRAWVTQQ
jgi:hypothetical protein